jgi:hypothetical protein
VIRRAAIAGALGAALLAPPAAAQDWDALFTMVIETASEMFAADGYAYAGFAHEGELAEGASEDVAVRLGPGLDVILSGMCDGDCDNLDLALYDSSGNEVASDFEMDGFPILTVSPATSGVYRLRVIMADCRMAPCRYAVQPFARPPGESG